MRYTTELIALAGVALVAWCCWQLAGVALVAGWIGVVLIGLALALAWYQYNHPTAK
jgi:hypothetical protein